MSPGRSPDGRRGGGQRAERCGEAPPETPPRAGGGGRCRVLVEQAVLLPVLGGLHPCRVAAHDQTTCQDRLLGSVARMKCCEHEQIATILYSRAVQTKSVDWGVLLGSVARVPRSGPILFERYRGFGETPAACGYWRPGAARMLEDHPLYLHLLRH